MIGLAISLDSPRVTLAELQTVYSLWDLYDLIEVGMVNAHNLRIVRKVKP